MEAREGESGMEGMDMHTQRPARRTLLARSKAPQFG